MRYGPKERGPPACSWAMPAPSAMRPARTARAVRTRVTIMARPVYHGRSRATIIVEVQRPPGDGNVDVER